MSGPLDFSDVDGTIQRVRLELYRENIRGALALVDAAAAAHPDSRYVTEAEGIRQRLVHVQSRSFCLADCVRAPVQIADLEATGDPCCDRRPVFCIALGADLIARDRPINRIDIASTCRSPWRLLRMMGFTPGRLRCSWARTRHLFSDPISKLISQNSMRVTRRGLASPLRPSTLGGRGLLAGALTE